MESPAHRICYTLDEYVALEASSNVKHEYLEGQIYAMAGGTPEHAALAAAAIGLLFPQLRGGNCRVHDADLRVRIGTTGLSTYPDVTVVCGPRERDAEDKHAITNPTVIIEVLSDSTEGYDRGDKFEHYKRLPSLRQYVLISHRERTVEVWTREQRSSAAPADWSSSIARDGEMAQLDSIGARLNVSELYEASAEPAV